MSQTLVTASLVLAIAFAATSPAQGRHDDKPHGPPAKQVEEKMMAEPKVHPGGRHDAQSHKNAIAAHNRALAKKKKIAAEKATGTTASPKPEGASK